MNLLQSFISEGTIRHESKISLPDQEKDILKQSNIDFIIPVSNNP